MLETPNLNELRIWKNQIFKPPWPLKSLTFEPTHPAAIHGHPYQLPATCYHSSPTRRVSLSKKKPSKTPPGSKMVLPAKSGTRVGNPFGVRPFVVLESITFSDPSSWHAHKEQTDAFAIFCMLLLPKCWIAAKAWRQLSSTGGAWPRARDEKRGLLCTRCPGRECGFECSADARFF